VNRVTELFGRPTKGRASAHWAELVRGQWCPYLDTRCTKVRKSQPDVSIGTCTVRHGSEQRHIVICPHRLLERSQVFVDSIHPLTLHEPGNELHVVNELRVPGGRVDHCLVSVRGTTVVDFVGIELQTIDTTGTVWPERQRFLQSKGIAVDAADAESAKPFGMNWKMTAKTTPVQMHHKAGTFDHIGKHLVLALQDHLLHYMADQFDFADIGGPHLGDAVHFHAYSLSQKGSGLRLALAERLSTDESGIARCLGLAASRNVDLSQIISQLEARISSKTVLRIGP